MLTSHSKNIRDYELYDYVPIGICVIGNNYEVLFWNKCLKGWTGLGIEEVRGKNLLELYPHLQNPIYKLRIDLMFKGHPPTYFSSLLHRYFLPVKISEKEFQVQSATLTSIPVAENEYNVLIAIENHTNLAERVNNYKQMKNKALEEVKRRIEAEEKIKEYVELLEKSNATKDKFFSIIAHDLRSPLSIFIGLTQTMAENIHEFSIAELQDTSRTMNETSNKLYSLLENLLQWSRMQRGVMEFNPEECRLDLVIKNNITVVYELAKNKNIEIINNADDEVSVKADLQMLNTVLRNLLSNAIKFTHRGGRVEVGLLTGENWNDNEVCVFVKDNGVGMDSKTLQRLFQIDQISGRPGTENEPSTGLGLILCKEFIQKHNGKIWVSSLEGQGSTFYFTLPH